jgi:hypothetical protein
MKIQNIEKHKYTSPLIKQIQLDNEISLVLESTPPSGPNEGYLKAPEYLNNDPFITGLV